MQIAARVLGLLGQYIRSLGGALKLRLALKVEQDSRFFYLAVFEYALYDFVAVEWLAGFFEYISDDVSNCSLAVTP